MPMNKDQTDGRCSQTRRIVETITIITLRIDSAPSGQNVTGGGTSCEKARFSSSEATPVNMHKKNIGKSKLSKMSKNNGETVEGDKMPKIGTASSSSAAAKHQLALSLFPSSAFSYTLSNSSKAKQQISPIRQRPSAKVQVTTH
ncbi:hypothetical protein niasHT_032466 [Heterodera trifolii]|uniref:Uncharacterized protein n=1 Tax=Heterodera trifolii TaxID=157864 RepID=A0ABD2IMF2_9BILA